MERDEFLRLANAHKDMIYRLALNMLRSPYDADDVVEEYSVREIADLLRVTVSAVTTRLSRARRKLETALTEAMQHEI